MHDNIVRKCISYIHIYNVYKGYIFKRLYLFKNPDIVPPNQCKYIFKGNKYICSAF